MTSALSISNLSYSISNVEIFKTFNLEVSQQSYFAIAGVNGAGKSTLIKLILDLIRPSNNQSEIQVLGINNQDRRCRDAVAYLPEKFDVKRNVTGWQYLQFIASIYGEKLDKVRVMDDLCIQLDFPNDRLQSKVGSYSKGMVQKLGLISCFMLDSKLLILDEPLSGLDPRARYHFKQFLIDEKCKGLTVFYSTHMLADAEDICDQFGILHGGEMKFVGTPSACIEAHHAVNLEQAYIRCISNQVDQ
jgi:ABC-2 type transport system ATP-binding protein